MKRRSKLLILLPLISLFSCNGNSSSILSSTSSEKDNSSIVSSSESLLESNSSSEEISSIESSSEELSSSIDSSSEELSSEEESSSEEISSSEESSSISIELALSLVADGTLNNEGIYEVKVYDTMQLIPTFNDSTHVESVTYTTKEGIFGGASTNISIDSDGVLHALSKSDVITITCTSNETNLTSSIKVKVYAELDNYSKDLTASLNNALTHEKDVASHGVFYYEKSSNGVTSKIIDSNFDVFANSSLEAHEKDASESESYIFSGMHNSNYYYVKKNSNGEYVDVRKRDVDANNASSLYQINLSAFNSFYGVSSLVKYLFTDSSYLGNSSAYNHASVNKEMQGLNSVYTITSSFETTGFSNNYTEYSFELFLSSNDELLSFDFNKKVYDSNGYDFDSHKIKENGTIYSEESISSTLSYETRLSSSSSFSIDELFLTSYDVVLKNKATGEIGTSFEVDTTLSFEYGTNYAPETAYPSIDPLIFVSSSNNDVVSLNENNELVCLSAGNATLTFSSSNGVEKNVEVNVTFSGITGIELDSSIKAISKLKVGDSVSNITATTIPNLDSQPYTISITDGNEYASLTKEADGTYTLVGIQAGMVTITASTTYGDSTFTDTHTLEIYSPLTDEEIKQMITTHSYVYTNTTWAGTTTHTLTFTDTSGSYVTSSYTITFDYEISEGTIALSNISSTSTNYVLSSLELSDDATSIVSSITENSMFGSYKYTYTLKAQ